MEVIQRPLWMKDAVIIVTTLAVFALITFIYIKLKPTVVIPPESAVSTCPARWVYMTEKQECQPQYPTKCKPFNPESFSDSEKCSISQACGTYWKGLCDFKG